MKFALQIGIVALLLGMIGGCSQQAPKTFSTIKASEWSMMEIREGINYDQAWNAVFELLTQEFDIDKAMKEHGYIQTQWLYTWSGTYLPSYRVRVTARFNEDRSALSIKPEAQSLQGEVWVVGSDTRLVTTLKTDLMGRIGRTTR